MVAIAAAPAAAAAMAAAAVVMVVARGTVMVTVLAVLRVPAQPRGSP
jgi:hypothetical protein